jgi:tyrosine-protein kinase Etk/Wzc
MPEPRDDTDTGRDGGLIDYALVVWRHLRLVGGVLAVGLCLTALVSLLLPRMYESTATLIAPKEGPNTGLLGSLAVVTGLVQQTPNMSVPSLTPNRDMLVSILKSRTMAQTLITRLRLQERYGARYMEDAIRKLEDHVRILVSKEGVISVRVEDTEPQVAADIANLYLDELDRLVGRYGTSEAGNQRSFLTTQLAQARVGLDSAEEKLRRFQERNRAVALQEQTRGAIEAAARLKGEIMLAEVQLQVVRNFATESNPDTVALRRRIEEMRRQLVKLESSDGVMRGIGQREQGDFTVPLPKVPEVGIELARLTRDVKVQETLVLLLTQQNEQARIAEAKDVPIVQILDRAVPAERHARPRLRINLAIGGVTSIFVGIFLAFLMDYVRNYKSRRDRDAL